MPIPPALRLAVCALAAVSVATACTDAGSSAPPLTPQASHAQACAAIPVALVRDTQRYIDGFSVQAQPVVLPTASASASASATPTRSPSPMTDAGFTAAVTTAQQKLATLGCDAAAFRAQLEAGLGTVSSSGPVAKAMLAQLAVSLTGRLAAKPIVRTLTAADDLSGALAEAPEGSTLTLRAGTYRLPDTLVLLRGVTLRGAGQARTVLTGAPADASVLVLTDKPVQLSGLTVRRNDSVAGSGVVTGAVAALTLRDVRVTGSVSSDDGRGGTGVLMSATEGDAPSTRTTTLDVTDSQFDGNQSAGIAVGGWHRARITHSAFLRNEQCGVCFLGTADGTVSDSEFDANAVGIAAAVESRPRIRQNTFTDGKIAVQAGDTAVLSLIDNTITRVARVAILFTGRSSGRVDGNTCPKGQAGIAVAKTAYPYVATNSCTVTVVR